MGLHEAQFDIRHSHGGIKLIRGTGYFLSPRIKWNKMMDNITSMSSHDILQQNIVKHMVIHILAPHGFDKGFPTTVFIPTSENARVQNYVTLYTYPIYATVRYVLRNNP